MLYSRKNSEKTRLKSCFATLQRATCFSVSQDLPVVRILLALNNGVFDEKEGGYIGGAIMYTHRGSCIHELDGQEE